MYWTRRALPFAALLALAACDPDLTPVTVPGTQATPEGGVTPPAPTDAGPTGEGGASDAGADGSADAGPTGHKIDGTNDFLPGEKLVTSSPGYDGYVAWDAKNVYLGMSGKDIGTGASASKWVLVYIEGAAGTTTGLDYGGQQQPTLPFSATYHVRVKTDLSYRNGQKWTGAAWVDATAMGLVPDVERKGDFMEMAITRASLGDPAKLKIHMNMLIEGGGADWTYAAVPSTSLTDGLNPAYTKYFEFDLADLAKAPNTYAPKP